MTGLDLTLLRPYWLLALPALAVAGWWLWHRRGSLGDWTRAADPALMRAMAALGRVDTQSGRRPLSAALAVAALIALALAGPAMERRDSLSFRNLDGVLFVVDASPSVSGSARWTQMLTMGRFGIASLGTRPGGLIVYGGDAYVATGMTHDYRQLGQTFSLIDGQTVPDPGSRPERALLLAADVLRAAEVVAGDVILFTDGDGLGAATQAAATQIAAQGARLSLVSLEAPTPSMAAHAEATGGRVFALDQTDDLSAWLREDARTRLERQDYPLLFWKDFGRLILVAALIPMILLFRRRVA